MKKYYDNIKSYQEIIGEFQYTFTTLSVGSNEINKQLLENINEPSSIANYGYSSPKEYNSIKEKSEIELERKFILDLIAAFEAKIVYFILKIAKKNSTVIKSYNYNISQKTRNAIKIGQKHLMYNHIILVFKDIIQPIDNKVYAEFLELLDYRNWLAHGRGWNLEFKLDKYDFQYSLQTLVSLLNLLPDYPDKLKE